MDIESKNKASDQYSINSMQTSKVQENIPTEDRDKNKNVYIERYILNKRIVIPVALQLQLLQSVSEQRDDLSPTSQFQLHPKAFYNVYHFHHCTLDLAPKAFL